MAELNCSIEVDFSFEQIDCHWELNRFFRLTWRKTAGSTLWYRLGEYSDNIYDYKQINTSKVYTKDRTSYIYELPLTAFTYEELAAARDSDGWITLTVYNGSSAYKTFNKVHLVELPPVFKESTEKIINTEFVVNNPGEIRVSWDASSVEELDGSVAENSPDCLDGYSIEVFRCPKGLDPTVTTNFTRLSNLRWKNADPETGMPTTGAYILQRVSTNAEIEIPEGANVETYVGLGSDSEARIENPLKTEFFFNPKHLGIKPSDHYQFVIRPYSHYQGALISTEGIESEIYKVRPGFVHVKTANGWEAGQVWVYANTKDGPKWVVAESVYVAAAGETEGTITWKEAK